MNLIDGSEMNMKQLRQYMTNLEDSYKETVVSLPQSIS